MTYELRDDILRVYQPWFKMFSEMGRRLNIYNPQYDSIDYADPRLLGVYRTVPDTGLPFHDYCIITTNYDNVLENFVQYILKEQSVAQGFETKGNMEVLDLDNIHKVWKDGAAVLLKLHGSIDWKRLNNGYIVKGTDPLAKNYGAWKVVDDIAIFPAQRKLQYQDKLFELLYWFKRFLRENPIWVFIGYSFRDELILDLIKSEWNLSKVMIIISPHAKDRKRGLAERGFDHEQNIHPISGDWTIEKTQAYFQRIQELLTSHPSQDVKDEINKLENTTIID